MTSANLPNEKLRNLYQEIASLTRPKCGQCLVPWQCCAPEHCDMVRQYAWEEYEIRLAIVDENARLPYLNPDGTCSVEPWLRPICAVHVCERHFWKDLDFCKRYSELREQIEIADFERMGGIPTGDLDGIRNDAE